MIQGVDAVLFDYGGVLTTPVRESIAAWIAADGIVPEAFSRTLKAWMSRHARDTPIHGLETGELSVEEFEARFAAQLETVDGRPVEPAGILARLFAEMRPDEAMFELVEELRSLGLRVGLLSNSWGNSYPRFRLDALLDSVVISEEVRLRKPQSAIFKLAVDRLGVPAGRVVFVDDAEPNLVGARAAGLQTLLHESPDTTRAALAALIPTLSPSRTGVIS